MLEPRVGHQSWSRERGSRSMLPKLFFCVKVVIRVVVEGGCQSSELIVEVGRSKVVVRVCSRSCFCKGGRQRWSLEFVVGGGYRRPELVIEVDRAKMVI